MIGQLKHDVWNARTRLENDVAETKDEAALDAFDTIAAADASLAASLGAAGIKNAILVSIAFLEQLLHRTTQGFQPTPAPIQQATRKRLEEQIDH